VPSTIVSAIVSVCDIYSSGIFKSIFFYISTSQKNEMTYRAKKIEILLLHVNVDKNNYSI